MNNAVCSAAMAEKNEMPIISIAKKIDELYLMSDEDLALTYIDGDNRAFDILLERNQEKLFSYILFVVRNRDFANDIFQDTFLKVITKLQNGDYRPSGKFSAWLTRIAHNILMDRYRSLQNDGTIDVGEENDMAKMEGDLVTDQSMESYFINEQVFSDIKMLMEKLPPVQREVVFMRYFQELSFKEIAEMTDVSINTALGRMHYALQNLRRMIKKNKLELQMV